MSRGILWLFVGALLVSALGTGAMRRYAVKRNLLDVPNMRSSHSAATPRGGGVAIVVAFFAALLALDCLEQLGSAFLISMFAGGLAVALIGFLDDRRPLKARWRFAVHLAAAALAVGLIGGLPAPVLVRWGMHGAWLGSSIAVAALIWATNLFNFMDGIDGIAASKALFVALGGAVLTYYASGDVALAGAMLGLGGASLGFLLWNWPPARIFMGDVGSGFLGFSLGTLGLAASQSDSIPAEVWAILGGGFLTDATVTLVRRVLRGERWFDAHRSHAYQRLARRWGGHQPVTLLSAAINLFWLLPWAWLTARHPEAAAGYLAAALLPLAALAVWCGAGDK